MHRLGRELLAVVVEDERVPPVELREVDEVLLGHDRRRRGHRASEELVHACGQRRAAAQREAQPVARAPAVRPQEEIAGRRDVLAHELGIALEAAGREEQRLGVLRPRRRQAHVARSADERLGQLTRIEPHADRVRIARLLPHDLGAQRAQPLEAVVQALDHLALQLRVAAGTFRAERIEVAVAPHDARGQQHRAAGPVALFVDDRLEAELARACGRAEAGHATAEDGQQIS